MERIITNKRTIKITVDAGWYSEQEMKDELNWGQPLCSTKHLVL